MGMFDEKISFGEKVSGLYDWMKDASGDGYCDGLDELDGEAYEVKVDIYLDSGLIIHLSNHCVESFLKNDYRGDDMRCVDGFLELLFRDTEGRYHQTVVRQEHVTMIDGYNEPVDWKPILEK